MTKLIVRLVLAAMFAAIATPMIVSAKSTGDSQDAQLAKIMAQIK